MTVAACPICKRPGVEAYRPFCSKRCADVDLQRWLVGAYVIPDEDGEGSGLSSDGDASDDEA